MDGTDAAKHKSCHADLGSRIILLNVARVANPVRIPWVYDDSRPAADGMMAHHCELMPGYTARLCSFSQNSPSEY